MPSTTFGRNAMVSRLSVISRCTKGVPKTRRARSASYTPDWRLGRAGMTFRRTMTGLVVLLIAGLAASFYVNWRTLGQLRTVKAFVEGSVFADAVAACERAQSTTPFKWNGGKQTAIIGLNSVKLNKDTVIASYTLFADGIYCDYDPVKKKADIGSNFLERD